MPTSGEDPDPVIFGLPDPVLFFSPDPYPLCNNGFFISNFSSVIFDLWPVNFQLFNLIQSHSVVFPKIAAPSSSMNKVSEQFINYCNLQCIEINVIYLYIFLYVMPTILNNYMFFILN